MEFHVVTYGSELYKKSVKLRKDILRKPLGLKFSKSYLEKEKRDFHLICLDNNQKVIGVLILSPLTDTIIKMRQVAILETKQNKGIGRMLVEFSERFAIENKYRVIELHSRESAISFYKKLKYKIVSKQFYEIGLPHYKMIKAL